MTLGATNQTNTLNWWLRNSTINPPGTITVGLYSGDPGTAGTVNEFASANGHNYARQGGSFNAPSGGSAAAAASISFTDSPAGTVSFIGIWAGTTFIIGGTLTGGAQPVTAGNTFTLATLSVALSG